MEMEREWLVYGLIDNTFGIVNGPEHYRVMDMSILRTQNKNADRPKENLSTLSHRPP